MATKGNVIEIHASKDDFEAGAQDQGDFVVPPNGYYILQLDEANPGFSQGEDGKPDKSRPRVECVYSVVGVGVDDEPATENYGKVWDYVTFGDKSGFSRGRFLVAFGYADGKGEFSGKINLDEAVGQKVLARLRRKKDRQQPGETEVTYRARIASLLPYENRTMVDAFGAVEEGDEPADEPFAGATAADDGGPEEYSREELEALEPKALGELATEEFDINPQDHVVKVRNKVNVEKSVAKLIDAILEAQEAEAAEGDDATSGSPF